MPFSGGVHSLTNNFVTEAAAPPIEIAKLDTTLEDISDSLSACVLRDGTGLPTASLNMNAQTITNIGAATTLTGAARVSELIDQDHIYYVDSGSANTLVITPSPAIAAYEEGQRFVVRVTNNNSGASTLNVNGLGAFAIQHPDGSAMQSGALIVGGIYEFTYDANTSPDRWVLTSPASEIADGMLSSNVALKNADNAFSANQSIQTAASAVALTVATSHATSAAYSQYGTNSTTRAYFGAEGGLGMIAGLASGSAFVRAVSGGFGFSGDDGTTLNFALSSAGLLTTPNASSAEPGFKGVPAATDETPVLTDAGKLIVATGNVTVPANSSIAFPINTVLSVFNSTGGNITIAVTTDSLTLAAAGSTGTRTLAATGLATLVKITSTSWVISGAGLS
jgi:hypothetical protein